MTGWLGKERVDLAICDSTNDEAAALAASGAAPGTVVIARAQRAGRGRQARRWYSPAGQNLYLSCVLRPPLEPDRVPGITLAAGVAVARSVKAAGVEAIVKWPNDVLADRGPGQRPRKLAGILTEMTTRANRVEYVIVGIGVNLKSRHFPPELADRATSLSLEGAEVDSEAYLSGLLQQLETWLERFFSGGIAAIRDEWLLLARLSANPRSAQPDRDGPLVRVLGAGAKEPIEGRVVTIDESGHLCVETGDGEIHRIVAGDVELASSVPFRAGQKPGQ